MKRRTFLRQTAVAATPLLFPDVLTSLADFNPSVTAQNIVLIHLNGGNDGYNTLVPYTSEAYYRMRPALAVGGDEVIKLDEKFGLHPALSPLKSWYDKRNMLCINNVTSTVLDDSHHTSRDVWKQAFGDTFEDIGFSDVSPTVNSDEFARELQQIANSIIGDAKQTCYQISIDGFDTHHFQKAKHAALLTTYAEGVDKLLTSLEAANLLNNTLVITWSEFGRQLKENTAKGTGHGSNGLLIVHGGNLIGYGIRNDAMVEIRDAIGTIKKLVIST